MLIYLIRHGETEWNNNGVLQGTQDVLLNDKGIKQGEALNRYFKEKSFDILCSSHLKRAFHTAELLNKGLNKTIFINEDLREIELGVWEGLTWDEVKVKFLKEHQGDPNAFLNVKAEGGESYKAFAQRANEAFESIIKAHIGKDIVMVTHGGVIKAIIQKLLDIDISMRNRIEISNASITTLEYDSDKAHLKLMTLNAIDHLK